MQGSLSSCFPWSLVLGFLRAGSSVLTLKDERTSNSAKGNNFGLRPSAENSRLKRDHMSKNYMIVEAELPI